MADTNNGWENQADQPQDDVQRTAPLPPTDHTTDNGTSWNADQNAADTAQHSDEQPTAYTPAPEYGAYGPVPTQPAQQTSETQQMPPQHQQNPYGAY